MVSSPEKESRQSPTVSTQNLHKSRNSTIRREDQQLYDNAIGKIDHQLLQVSAGCFLPLIRMHILFMTHSSLI